MTATPPIGDPRPAGEDGPAGDPRDAGQEGVAGDPRPAGAETVDGQADDDAELKGAALDKALEDAGLSKSGTADEKRARLADHDA